MAKNTKPIIRFKGFTDAWEQRKLGEITESYSGGTPTVGNNAYYDGDIPFIRSGEISGDYTELFITSEGLNSSSAKMVKEGDILYALYGATSGEVSISKLKGAINQAILAIQPHQNYDNQFLMQWLKKSKKYIIDTYLQGGQGNLSGNIVKNLPVDLPTYDEQHQIGAYFKHLDNLITLHQRKYDSLVNVKKAMLEKMFPKNGETVPEIRFKGFTDAWEQRKLSELGEIMTGSTPSTSKTEYYSEDGIPWVTPTDINEQTICDTPRKLSEEGAKVGRVVPANTILCTCIASIGKNTLLTVKGSFNQQINSLTPNEDNDAYFLLTESENWSDKMKRMAASGTMQIVNKTEFSELLTRVPKLEEQEKIGTYFLNLDNLITLHQRKLEKLKNIKKSCLEKMFV